MTTEYQKDLLSSNKCELVENEAFKFGKEKKTFFLNKKINKKIIVQKNHYFFFSHP